MGKIVAIGKSLNQHIGWHFDKYYPNIGFLVNGGGRGLLEIGGDNSDYGPFSMNLGSGWTTLGVTRKESNWKFYINDTLVKETTSSVKDVEGELEIGGSSEYWSSTKGHYKNLIVFSKELSGEEIKSVLEQLK